MKITRLAAATAVAALMVAGAASANTLKINNWSAGSGESVNFGSTNAAAGSAPRTVNAGAFNVTDTNPGTLGSFIAFCLDLAATVQFGQSYPYNVTTTPFSNSIDLVASGAVDRLQAIFDSSYSTTVATASSVTSAGFQLALWNAVYDTDWSVTQNAGAFWSNSNANVTAQANAYLTAASTYSDPQKWNLTYLESTSSPRHQNLVTASPVPLPAAGLMLLGALGGLVGLRRRRKAA